MGLERTTFSLKHRAVIAGRPQSSGQFLDPEKTLYILAACLVNMHAHISRETPYRPRKIMSWATELHEIKCMEQLMKVLDA